MSKDAISFGENGELVGIFQRPGPEKNSQLCVLILNAGLSHHIGPFQMSTMLANALEKGGVSSFRFDLSGVGDSNRDPLSNKSLEDQHLQDMTSAVDYLENEKGYRSFVVFGSCTGADNAHKLAASDQRISGAVFLDGYAYSTGQHIMNRTIPVLLSPSRLLGVTYRFFKRVLGGAGDGALSAADLEFTWLLPPKARAENDYKAFIARNVKLCFVFSGGAGTYYSYPEQVFDAFQALDMKKISTVVEVPQADHVYVLVDHRQEMVTKVANWLYREFDLL